MWLNNMQCHQHDETLIDTYEFPSAYEQMSKDKTIYRLKNVDGYLFNKKVVQTFKCSKCKRIRQVTHTHEI